MKELISELDKNSQGQLSIEGLTYKGKRKTPTPDSDTDTQMKEI
jgi:hypothetical protein